MLGVLGHSCLGPRGGEAGWESQSDPLPGQCGLSWSALRSASVPLSGQLLAEFRMSKMVVISLERVVITRRGGSSPQKTELPSV